MSAPTKPSATPELMSIAIAKGGEDPTVGVAATLVELQWKSRAADVVDAGVAQLEQRERPQSERRCATRAFNATNDSRPSKNPGDSRSMQPIAARSVLAALTGPAASPAAAGSGRGGASPPPARR